MCPLAMKQKSFERRKVNSYDVRVEKKEKIVVFAETHINLSPPVLTYKVLGSSQFGKEMIVIKTGDWQLPDIRHVVRRFVPEEVMYS